MSNMLRCDSTAMRKVWCGGGDYGRLKWGYGLAAAVAEVVASAAA